MLHKLLSVAQHIGLKNLLDNNFGLSRFEQVRPELQKINFNVKHLFLNGETSVEVKQSKHSQIRFFKLLIFNNKKLL
jgi:hypothetical protein